METIVGKTVLMVRACNAFPEIEEWGARPCQAFQALTEAAHTGVPALLLRLGHYHDFDLARFIHPGRREIEVAVHLSGVVEGELQLGLEAALGAGNGGAVGA